MDKRVLYRRLGVREYWLFDETGTRLPDDAVLPPGGLLVGYRLARPKCERARPSVRAEVRVSVPDHGWRNRPAMRRS